MIHGSFQSIGSSIPRPFRLFDPPFSPSSRLPVGKLTASSAQDVRLVVALAEAGRSLRCNELLVLTRSSCHAGVVDGVLMVTV